MKNMPHIKVPPQNEAQWLQTLMDLARFLRSDEGCPWDRKQQCRDFAGYVQEEAQELVEAFDGDGGNEHIAEEWGDTFFTLLATMAAAETEGRFSLRETLERTHEKMVRRHGHIFGDHEAESATDVEAVWQKIKEQEKGGKG